MIKTPKARSKPSRPRPERLAGARDEISRRTSALPDGPLRVDFGRLGDGEASELCELTDRLYRQEPLDERGARRWEELAARGAGTSNFFEQVRDRQSLHGDIAAIVRQALKPRPRPRFEEPGAVVLAPAWTFAWLKRNPPALHLEHLAILGFCLTMLENAESLTPHGRIEGVGDDAALVISEKFGLGSRFDPQGRLGLWRKRLNHLDRNGLLRVEQHGSEIYVRRGRHVLASAKRRAA